MEVLSIGDVCEFSRGLTYKKSDEVSLSSNAVLRANNITLDTGKINFDEVKYISDEINIPESKKVKKGSLLICTASGSKKHLGKIGRVDSDIDFAYGGFMGMLTPKDNIDSKYLYWLTQSKEYFDFIQGLTDGANINNLKFSQLTQFPVPIFELEEQKRIVAILDQAFADIEQARAKTEQNLKNARELFESYLQKVFSQRGEGVIEVPLSEITESISDGDHAAPPKSEDGIPFITISNINKFTNEIDFTNTFKVPESYYSALKITRKPLQGDVLYTVTGSYGIPVIVKEEKEFCFQRHIGLVRPNNNTDSNWLYYLLMSPQVFKQADEGATGAAQKTVSLKLLRSLRVPKVPLKEQVNMVEGLNFMHQKSKQLTEIYTRKLESLDELKKSILQKAFSGELSKDKEGAAA